LQPLLRTLLQPLLHSLLHPLLRALLHALLQVLYALLLHPLLHAVLHPLLHSLLHPLLHPVLQSVLRPLLLPLRRVKVQVIHGSEIGFRGGSQSQMSPQVRRARWRTVEAHLPLPAKAIKYTESQQHTKVFAPSRNGYMGMWGCGDIGHQGT